MGRARRDAGTGGANALLLVALGAVAGIAIGMAVADRVGGLEGLLRRGGGRRSRRSMAAAEARHEAVLAGPPHEWAEFDGYPDDLDDIDDLAAAEMEEQAAWGGAPTSAAVPEGERAAGPAVTRPRREPDEELPSADDLEARVLEVFRNDLLLAERNIDIGADHHGRVELTGWVETPDEVEYALTLARGVPQVSSVMSNLMIRRRATR